jgi:RNA polymerase II elongation factor ELL
MPLPSNGVLALNGSSRPGETVQSKPKQAMIVRMSEQTLKALSTFPNNPPIQIEFGDKPVQP